MKKYGSWFQNLIEYGEPNSFRYFSYKVSWEIIDNPTTKFKEPNLFCPFKIHLKSLSLNQ